MAIVKTTFLANTQADNAVEVLTWLQNNATAYFDTIEADVNGNILCKIGNNTALRIGFDGSTTTNFTIANGNNYESRDTSEIFTYAIRTSKGLFLTNAGESSYNPMHIFISKSDVGTTCFAARIRNFSYDTVCPCADFVHSTSIFVPSISVQEAENTSLTHLVFNGGFYAPDLYAASFSQFGTLACNFSIDNKKYTTDGVLVLAE